MLRRGQHLDRVRAVVGLRSGLVHLAHAALADGVEQHVRPEDQPLRLAVEDALGLERGERALRDEVLGQGRGLGPRVLLEELADELVELAAVDQAAPPEVPDEPFALAEFAGHHGAEFLLGGTNGPGHDRTCRWGQPDCACRET